MVYNVTAEQIKSWPEVDGWHVAPTEERIRIGSDVTIGPNVSIGSYVTIADGVSIGAWARIGAGAIIGSGAYVNRDVSPYAVVPAVQTRP